MPVGRERKTEREREPDSLLLMNIIIGQGRVSECVRKRMGEYAGEREIERVCV